MLFYISCILFVVFLYPFFFRFQEHGLQQEKRWSYLYEITIAAALILIIGLRKKTIGIDSPNYVDNIYWYYSHVSFERLQMGLKFLGEPGYKLLNWFLGYKLGAGYPVLFMVCAFVSVAPVAVLIHKYSDSPQLSWCFYIFFGFYTFCFSTMRQAFAMGITVLAFLCIQKKQPVKFVLLVLLAMMFHKTAIIFLPMYWLRYWKISWINIVAFTILGIMIYVFKGPILAFLNELSTNYYGSQDVGGKNQFIFILLLLISVVLMRKQFEESNPVNSLVFFMVASTATIFLMLKVNPALFRLYFYYYIYVILYIPNQLKIIKGQALRWGITAMYVLIGGYFFYSQMLSADIKLIYYEFFWQ